MTDLRFLGGSKPKPTEHRFHKSYIKDKDTGCWNWIGKSRSGSSRLYGRIKVDGKTTPAHRYSWELHNQKTIPKGMIVMHKCDNPQCVNPDHLSIGTHQDNMSDMVKKGRQSKSNHERAKGEKNGNSKLTKKIAKAIFNDNRPQRQIAKSYGITQAAVSLIKRKITWRNIHE
jgi:hypothetical protein